MTARIKGFDAFYNNDSKLLVLGSFPSFLSRKTDFYYGNPQNRFWRVLAEYFGCAVPLSVDDKKEFLKFYKIALWDVVAECEIVGSMDTSIKNFSVADVENLLQKIGVGLIILNGSKAYEIFVANFSDISVPYIKLPSTSPANTRFSKDEWFNALSRVFGRA